MGMAGKLNIGAGIAGLMTAYNLAKAGQRVLVTAGGTREPIDAVRYVGNRGNNLWRSYNLNEVNIFENGFVQEFTNAQRNLQINQANGLTGFANNGLPGQAALPIFDAAFGPRGAQGPLAAGSGYTNGTFVTLLQQGQAGRLANTLGGTAIYLCRMVGSTTTPWILRSSSSRRP